MTIMTSYIFQLQNKVCIYSYQTALYLHGLTERLPFTNEVQEWKSTLCCNITEEKESELEEFIDFAKISMGAMGYKVFEPLVKSEEKDSDDELTLYFEQYSKLQNENIKAICKRTNEGFVLLKGSKILMKSNSKMPVGVLEARKKTFIDDYSVLQGNILFNSSSYAAAFVIGGHISGLKSWKDKNNKTLQEIELEES